MRSDTSTWFERSIIWGTVLLDLLILVGTLFFLIHSHNHYLERLDVAGQNLVQLLEQRIADKARLVDGAVLRVQRELHQQLMGGAFDKTRVLRQLRLEADTLPEVSSIQVANARGELLRDESLEQRKGISIAESPFFQTHKSQCAQGAVASRPMPDPVTGRLIIAFTRCFYSPDGGFGGVIFASVPLDVFSRILGNLNFGSSGTAVMRYDDGSLVIRNPPALEGELGLPGNKEFCNGYRRLLESGVPVGSFQAESKDNYIGRYCSYRRVMGWPFTITVGLVGSDYLAPWRIQATLGALLLGVLLLTTTAVAWITLRHLREQSLREKEREEDLVQRRILLEQSRDGIVILDRQGKVCEANRCFADMLGYSPEEIKNLHVWDWDACWAEEDIRVLLNRSDPGGDKLQTQHRRKDGQVIDVEISSNGAEFDGNKLIFCVCRDVSERNKDRAALKNSEEKYRVIFENQLYAMAIFDVVTLRFLDVNDAYLHMYGYNRTELLGGMTVFDVSAEGEQTRQAIEEAVDGGTIFIPLLYHRKKDGSSVPVEIVGGPFTWNGREVMFSMAHDISVRKQAEDALRASEEMYRSLISSLSDGFFACDNQGRVTYANESLAGMLGAAGVDDLLGCNIFEFLAPEDQARCQKVFPEAVQRGVVPLSQELLLVSKTGESFWAEVKPSLVSPPQGGVSVQGLVIDITKRRQAAMALKKSEERLHLALQATKDALWDWDLGADAMYASPRWFAMLGYTSEEIHAVGDLWFGLLHPDDVERANRELKEAIHGKSSFEIHVRLCHKNGDYLPVLTRGSVQRDDNGTAIRLAGTNTDLSEQRKMEEERRQWERQALQLQKAESLSRMAGAIAHHFNNLLSVVIGNVEMSLEDLDEESPAIPNLLAATRAGERAVEVSSLLLTYLGQTEGRHQRLDLGVLYQKSLPQLQELMPKGITLESHFFQVGPRVVGNANHLQRMVRNLLVNAVEAIGEGTGKIVCSMYLVGPTDISDQNRFPVDWDPLAQEYVCLQVQDSGVGIEIFDIEQLFDPFFSSKFTGRGLGLPVVMGIVRAHAGGITVESIPEKGSIFRVYLPVADDEPCAVEVKEKISPCQEKSVLLVEDEEQVRLMVQTMLKRLGYKCISVADGVEALHLYRDSAADIFLVICDLTMPTMDGWEFMAALRESAPNLPFILTSGYDESLVMSGERQRYPQVFLQKPYRKGELGVAIQTAIRQEPLTG